MCWMDYLHEILQALSMALAMGWEILWALILGFIFSAAVQAVVSKAEMKSLLPDDSPKSLLIATGLGAASSSCSYASVAIARSLIRKGANFTSSIAFEFASTNLVLELGIILLLLLGWQFMAAEFVGGLLMVFILALLMRLFFSRRLVKEATLQAEMGVAGKMEGHAAMDMSLDAQGRSVWQRLKSPEGVTAISHYFIMDVAMLWKDIAAGLVISGAIAVLVPDSFWHRFFLVGEPGIGPKIWGAFIGPVVSMSSFVCSIGNVPLAAVLWNGGISFGGVISFIFADLIIFPILNIYRKYYGLKAAALLFLLSYLAMALAGLIVEAVFELLHLIPTARGAMVMSVPLSLNYTAVLNLIFAVVAIVLFFRYRKTGGPEMMTMMDREMPATSGGSCH